jgi:hypothetical protein
VNGIHEVRVRTPSAPPTSANLRERVGRGLVAEDLALPSFDLKAFLVSARAPSNSARLRCPTQCSGPDSACATRPSPPPSAPSSPKDVPNAGTATAGQPNVVSKTDTVHFNPSRSHYYRCGTRNASSIPWAGGVQPNSGQRWRPTRDPYRMAPPARQSSGWVVKAVVGCQQPGLLPHGAGTILKLARQPSSHRANPDATTCVR